MAKQKRTKNLENLDSQNEAPVSQLEKIKWDTIRQLAGPSPAEHHETIMEESENFMNELYKMSKEFTPTDEVFFNVKEEDGIVQEIEFRDLSRDPLWKRPTSPNRRLRDQMFYAGIVFTRRDDWSAFSLETYWPTVYYGTWKDLKSYRPWGYSTTKTRYHRPLSLLLEDIKEKIEKINSKRKINEEISKTKNQLADTLQK